MISKASVSVIRFRYSVFAFDMSTFFVGIISILEYFEGLLDLYNKEKEKNKILELAKIPYLEGEIMGYKENTVSKNKIREIIYPTPTNPISYEIQTSDMYRKILQLLEEK